MQTFTYLRMEFVIRKCLFPLKESKTSPPFLWDRMFPHCLILPTCVNRCASFKDKNWVQIVVKDKVNQAMLWLLLIIILLLKHTFNLNCKGETYTSCLISTIFPFAQKDYGSKAQMEVPGSGKWSFSWIASMIKPFSLRLASLWCIYIQRKWDNTNIQSPSDCTASTQYMARVASV